MLFGGCWTPSFVSYRIFITVARVGQGNFLANRSDHWGFQCSILAVEGLPLFAALLIFDRIRQFPQHIVFVYQVTTDTPLCPNSNSDLSFSD